MTSELIKKLYEGKVVVMELPAHTSDRVQPLHVSVFSLFKHFVIMAYAKRATDLSCKLHEEVKLSDLDV